MSKRFQIKIVILDNFRSLSHFKNQITKSRDQNFKNYKIRNGQNVAWPMVIETQKRSLLTLYYFRSYRPLKNTVIFTLGNCPRPYICNRTPDNFFDDTDRFYAFETLYAQFMKKIKNRRTEATGCLTMDVSSCSFSLKFWMFGTLRQFLHKCGISS